MNPVKIGNINIDNPICLAPMAGFSALSFRVICGEMGAAYCPTELVSARSIRYNGLGRNSRYSMIDPVREKIPVIQLFGSEPEDFTAAVSKLLASPEAAVRAVEQAGFDIPVTCKTRTGYDDRDKGGPDFVRALAESGAAMICIHGRTRPQMYAGYADYDAVARMTEAVRPCNIPVFANGDVKDGKSALKALDRTGADGLMVGRAARGNPWVFRRIRIPTPFLR